MADESQLELVGQGPEIWNDWRKCAGDIRIDLSEANLIGANLRGTDLSRANLRQANLSGANLIGANLSWANLRGTDLSRANLRQANLSGANLSGANLSGANLRGTDLSRANLSGANLTWANLSWANLRGTDLSGANLSQANLSRADFIGADLSEADLSEADLGGANLSQANLSRADLGWANLSRAYLRGANLDRVTLSRAILSGATLSEALFAETVLSNVDLSGCEGLELIKHSGPSVVDIRTLQRSGPLPLAFLRGVGLPDTLIEYLPSLLNQSLQLYSCFISYSAKDEEFVRRLHTDLQDKGVRCWFAPEDMKIGATILDTLDQAIRLRDKVLLVLSEASIASGWVEDEVTKGFAEERQRGITVLFPVRIDDAVRATNKAWAVKLRDNRHIGDFCHWKDHDTYQKTLARLLRDLRVETT